MSTNDQMASMKYDFSRLSKGRLRTYNRALQELENMQEARALDDDEIEMLAAAGVPFDRHVTTEDNKPLH